MMCGAVFAVLAFGVAPAHADTLFLSDRETTLSGCSSFYNVCFLGPVTYNTSSTHWLSRVTGYSNAGAITGAASTQIIFYNVDDSFIGQTEMIYGNGLLSYSGFAPFLLPTTFKVRVFFVPSFTPYIPYFNTLDLYEPAVSINSLDQLTVGETAIPEGGVTAESEVLLRVGFQSSFAEPLELQMEVRPAGVEFTGADDGWISTSTITSGDVATFSKFLPDGLWHWRARFVDSGGHSIPWMEFGVPGNADFRVQTVPPSADPLVLVQQSDGSVVVHTRMGCDISQCIDVGAASQVFSPLRSGNLESIEVFTANFGTDSSNPFTNNCYMRLVNKDTGSFIANSSNYFIASSCAGDLTFNFDNTSPLLQEGAHYEWVFMWGMQDHARLDFFGSPNNLVDGIFSPPPVVNAKFTARGVLREPVIIVPGIMGSRLNRVSDGEEVWPNIIKMSTPFNDKDAYLNELILNNDGQEDVARKMDPSEVLEEVSFKIIYKDLIDNFLQSGYILDTNFFTVPYDWRLDLASSTQRLDLVVKMAIANSPTGKVNIIAHSLGGLLVKEYLNQTTSTNFIDKLILAGAPEMGSPGAFKALTFGDNFGFTLGDPFDILNQERAKIISQNMPAVYQLLPSRAYLENIGGYIADYASSTLGLLDYEQSKAFMLRDPANNRNATLLTSADVFHQTLDAQSFNLSSSSVYRIVGCQNPKTIGHIRIYADGKFDPYPIDGDGTVPLESALYNASTSNNYFALYSETGIDHLGLVRDNRVVNLIHDIISNNPNPALPAGISSNKSDCGLVPANAPNETTIMFSTHSPVALHIYDAQGNHLGPNADGDIELAIPGGDYERFGENSFAFVPGNAQYRVVADATANGSFDLKVKVFKGISLEVVTTYLAVLLDSASTTAEMQFSNLNTAGVLHLDVQGDNAVDVNIQPIVTVSGTSTMDEIPPTITIISPENKDYLHSETLSISSTVSDDDSGVALEKVSLDNAEVSSSSIDLFYQSLGLHTVSVLAYDKVGNLAERSVSFRVIATPASTISNIGRALSLGWIKNKGVAIDLIQKLKTAIRIEKKIEFLEEKLPGKPNVVKRIEKLEERLDKILGKKLLDMPELQHSNGKINDSGYQVLKADIEWILDN